MTLQTSQVFQAGVDLLTSSKIPYIVIGGIAAALWGDPRETKDADFVIKLHPNNVGPLLRQAREKSFEIDEDVIRMNLEISGVARLLYGGRYVDLIVGESEFDLSALQRGRPVSLYDRDVIVTTPEDLILYKLVAHREQDIADIRRVLMRQGKSLDVDYLKKWAAVLAQHLGNPRIQGKLGDLLVEYGLGS